jgi:hypothetical protein
MLSSHIYNSKEKSHSKIHYTILVSGLRLVFKIFLVFLKNLSVAYQNRQNMQTNNIQHIIHNLFLFTVWYITVILALE